MLNKELLMAGPAQSQRKVVLTIGKAALYQGYAHGYAKDLINDAQLNVLPYWGTTDNVLKRLVYFSSQNTSVFLLDKDSDKVTVFVEGYQTSIKNGKIVNGDPYAMYNSEGSTRYLTFDPPPDGYLDPKTHKPS